MPDIESLRYGIEAEGDQSLVGAAAFLSVFQCSLEKLITDAAALLIGSLGSDGAMLLTVTASTARPIQLAFPNIPDTRELREAIRAQIPDQIYHTDVHGKPAWRKHMTQRLAEEIRAELQGLV